MDPIDHPESPLLLLQEIQSRRSSDNSFRNTSKPEEPENRNPMEHDSDFGFISGQVVSPRQLRHQRHKQYRERANRPIRKNRGLYPPANPTAEINQLVVGLLHLLKRHIVFLLLSSTLVLSTLYIQLGGMRQIARTLALIPNVCEYCVEAQDETPRVNFKKASIMQVRLAEVMASTLQGRKLAISMSESAYAVKDLRTRVRVSQLTYKNDLSGKLDPFFNETEAVIRELSSFNAEVASVAKSISSINTHVQDTLISFRKRIKWPAPTGPRTAALYSLFETRIVVGDDRANLRKDITNMTGIISAELPALLKHNKHLLQLLENLELYLHSVKEMALTEVSSLGDLSPEEQQREALAVLWLKVVGKGTYELEEFQKYTRRLESLVDCQKRAREIAKKVSVTLWELQLDVEEIQKMGRLVKNPPEVHERELQPGASEIRNAEAANLRLGSDSRYRRTRGG
ncbi:hypothetical protein FGG08_003926 [Glutinoglossum americanum]|uniref:Uncharacterized protein n=1 Tax=Glutinoglossum americanum TaxID=1670608 RepID=A0A9P8I1L1_9PEZI|nr:hypothetical protein FGG08_003926 [Glutinoglossum americanum]